MSTKQSGGQPFDKVDVDVKAELSAEVLKNLQEPTRGVKRDLAGNGKGQGLELAQPVATETALVPPPPPGF